MPALTKRYAFAICVAWINTEDAYEEALAAAGCDDATIVLRDGELHLNFEREAPSLNDAIGSAMHDIERAGGRILRIECIEE